MFMCFFVFVVCFRRVSLVLLLLVRLCFVKDILVFMFSKTVCVLPVSFVCVWKTHIYIVFLFCICVFLFVFLCFNFVWFLVFVVVIVLVFLHVFVHAVFHSFCSFIVSFFVFLVFVLFFKNIFFWFFFLFFRIYCIMVASFVYGVRVLLFFWNLLNQCMFLVVYVFRCSLLFYSYFDLYVLLHPLVFCLFWCFVLFFVHM